MWNQGKNCMGRRAFRKSNKSMQPGLNCMDALCRSVIFRSWQCTFLSLNFPNPHQDACAQLCPIILKICQIFKSPSGRVSTHESQICLNNNLKECFWWLSLKEFDKEWKTSGFECCWVLTGCNFNEVRTRCKRGPNEVRNQILGD